MNKRIRELIVQAGNYVNETYTGPVPATFAGYLVRYEDEDCDKWKLFNEKFAELIVRECMDCSTWVGKMNNNPIEPVHTARAINQRIREHFGVEE